MLRVLAIAASLVLPAAWLALVLALDRRHARKAGSEPEREAAETGPEPEEMRLAA